MKDKEEVELKVGELTQREEFGRGIIRIDSATMQKIGIREGDVVEIEGSRKTCAIALRSYPADAGLNIARMDGLVRRNAGIGVGDAVKIRKAEVKEAKKVTLAPAQEGIIVQISPNIIKQNIYYRPVVKGDIIVPSPVVKGRDYERTPSIFQEFLGFDIEEFFFTPTGETRFVVTSTDPTGIVRITDVTHLEILPRLPKGFELEARAVPAVTYEDIGGMHEAIQKVREMIELPLRHPELFCVAENTPILLDDGSIISAKELYDKLKSSSEKKITSKPDLEEVAVNSKIRILSINPKTLKIEPTKIKGAVKLSASRIYHIEGLSFIVDVSENEPFLTIDKTGKLLVKKAVELEPNEYVAVPSFIPVNAPASIHIRFVEVKKIKEIDGKFDLYDFETETGWFIGGFGPVVLHNTRLGIEPPKGVLLHGPPGCGKTLLAKAVANESGANFYSIGGPEIFSKWYGQTEENLRKIFEEAEKNAPSIIFIDEIDAIAPKREEVSGEVEKRTVSQLLTLMDGLKSRGKVIVIAATNVPNMLDPALRRPGRFDREIEIGIPDMKGRKEILEIHTRHMPLAKDVNLNKIAEITYGYTGADLSALTKEAAMHALRRLLPKIKWKEEETLPKEFLEKLNVTKADFDYALRVVEPSAMREVLIETPNVHWDDIGGLEEVKRELRETIEWPLTMPESFKRLGIEPPRGILLYGPPGCGKTLLAKAVATESNANFISIRGPELLSKWFGESERKVRELFRRAKQVAPAIIFFDEIDAMVPRRGLSLHEASERIVSQLLVELSGLEELHDVVVMAASVTGDTPILIKHNGKIELIPISKFVDSYYKIGEEGLEKPLVSSVEVLGFTPMKGKFIKGLRFSHSSFKKVRSVFRHRVDEIYEIEFIGGKIRTTGNHSVFVRTKKGIEPKQVSQLKAGDILVDLPYAVNLNDKKHRDLRSHVFADTFYLELPVYEKNAIWEEKYQFVLENIDNLSQHQIADKLGISQSTVSSWHHGICVPRAISLGYYKHALPSSVTVTPELMRLFGYYVAEGYARKEIDFCFNLKETKYVEDVKNLMNKIFGLKPDRIRNITKNAINIVYHSKPLAKFFIRHCGKGAKEKHFPPFLWEAPREYFLEFLRGYLSGDGHLDKRGRWEITSINKNLIIELNWLCRMHGIKTYVSKFRTKAGRKIYDNIIKKSSFAWRLGFSKSQNPFNDSRKFSVKRAIVKRVRKMLYEGYVYDLCGCDNEAFFGGETPILLHNTNRPDMLDPALLRPGRFDRQILVPAPDEKARLKILEVKTKNMPLKNVDLKLLAKKTENFSGADLEALCREAAMNALRENKEAKEVTMKHFENALKNISPSLSEPIIEFYKKFDERYKKKVIEETRKEEKELSYVG